MIQRLYVHNFRCLENFELGVKDLPAALLIGKNGTGKSTIAAILEILQSIARGANRVGELIRIGDFAQGRTDIPIRIEIEALIERILYRYVLALELPENFKEVRVAEESLSAGGEPVYSRNVAQVTLHSTARNNDAKFLIDWHLIALPVIQEQWEKDPLKIFKNRLAQVIVLSPIPGFMTGDSGADTLEPKSDCSNFGEWFSGLLSRYPAAYTHIEQYLKQVMPDLRDFFYQTVGKDFKSMVVRFEMKDAHLTINFKDLSDGEKCFFLCAVVLAANKFYGPLFCFWDEPDNYLSISEVGHFITSLRRSFVNKGQILVTSHNPEAIRRFSGENTLVLDRRSHLEPTVVRLLEDVSPEGDLIDALILGDLEL